VLVRVGDVVEHESEIEIDIKGASGGVDRVSNVRATRQPEVSHCFVRAM